MVVKLRATGKKASVKDCRIDNAHTICIQSIHKLQNLRWMPKDGEAIGKHNPVERHMCIKLPDNGPVFGAYSHCPHFTPGFQIKEGSVGLQNLLQTPVTIGRISGCKQVFIRIVNRHHLCMVCSSQQLLSLFEAIDNFIVSKGLNSIIT